MAHRVRWRARQKRDDRTGREIRDHLAEPDAEALGVGRVEQHLGAGECADLVDATDVVRMAVRANDAGDVFHRTPDTRQVGPEEPRGAGMPGVDQRDLVAVQEEISLGADEPNDMHVW